MTKIQRIMIDGNFTCPNRDGKVGTGGCTYCRNDSFTPEYCRRAATITEQIESGKKFFEGKYTDMKFLAYFQSYSGTYAPIDVLRQRYTEALACKDVVGLIVATRPDCLSEDILDFLQEMEADVEIGVESCHEHVLQRINRGHTWQQSIDAIIQSAERGLNVCVHIIIGLPGESQEEMLQGAEILSHLPISSIKLHQLQILKGTAMEKDFADHPTDFVTFPTAHEYVDFIRQYIKVLGTRIKVERIVSSAPSDILIFPRWGLKPSQIQALL